jgi:membrane protease YdiL (CAAX protease family)
MQNCTKCNHTLNIEAKFCTQCGNVLAKSGIENRTESLNLVIVFYVVFLLFAVISHYIYEASESSLGLDIMIESIFAILVVGFSILDFKGILKLYKLPIISKEIIAISLLAPVFSAIFVSLSVGYINELLFDSSGINYYSDYIYLENPLAWSILFVAILPPIFEELAFRGFLFNELSKVVSEKVTIIGTAFIFALVHFSFISLIWIFPFGLLLGYLRNKYKTLWYGIVIHFIHNLIVLLIDYYNYNSEFII